VPFGTVRQGLAVLETRNVATYTVVFDGGSLGNPGRGYGSFKIFGSSGELAHEALSFDDRGIRVTNNEAEYLSLIAALEWLSTLLGERAASSEVEVFGDSLLVINQLTGTWKVRKPDLKPLHGAAREFLGRFGRHRLQWHERLNSVSLLGH